MALLTSAKEVSRPANGKGCGLSFFAPLGGLFPSFTLVLCICALAPEASKGSICFSLFVLSVCIRRDEKGFVTNGTGSAGENTWV